MAIIAKLDETVNNLRDVFDYVLQNSDKLTRKDSKKGVTYEVNLKEILGDRYNPDIGDNYEILLHWAHTVAQQDLGKRSDEFHTYDGIKFDRPNLDHPDREGTILLTLPSDSPAVIKESLDKVINKELPALIRQTKKVLASAERLGDKVAIPPTLNNATIMPIVVSVDKWAGDYVTLSKDGTETPNPHRHDTREPSDSRKKLSTQQYDEMCEALGMKQRAKDLPEYKYKISDSFPERVKELLQVKAIGTLKKVGGNVHISEAVRPPLPPVLKHLEHKFMTDLTSAMKKIASPDTSIVPVGTANMKIIVKNPTGLLGDILKAEVSRRNTIASQR